MVTLETVIVQLFIGLLILGVGEFLGHRRGINQMKAEYTLETKGNEKREAEAIQKLKNSIFNEVEQNLRLLNKGYTTNKYGHRKYLNRLFRNAFDNALTTELYNSLSATIQKVVSSYYGEINRWNELIDELHGEDKALTLQAIFNQHNALETQLEKASTDLKELLKSR